MHVEVSDIFSIFELRNTCYGITVLKCFAIGFDDLYFYLEECRAPSALLVTFDYFASDEPRPLGILETDFLVESEEQVQLVEGYFVFCDQSALVR